MEPSECRKKMIRRVLMEHMDSYAVIGFDVDGNQIAIFEAPTDKDVLAVNLAFMNWYDEQFGEEELEATMEWEDDDEG
jgi:hypothetical protein